MLNRDLFEEKWKQIRGQTSGWWSLINSHDLDKVDKAEIKLDKFVTMLRVKYGYTREQAKKEITTHVEEYETSLKKS